MRIPVKFGDVPADFIKDKPMMPYTKQEVLDLPNKTEAEQYSFLVEKDIVLCIKTQMYFATIERYESLADCAFRLREEVGTTLAFERAVYEIRRVIDTRMSYENVFCWMVEKAKPIHWIMAALLAKLEADPKP